MVGRISIFAMAVAMVAVCACGADDQCIQFPNGSITCPTVAPPLPAVISGQHATQQSTPTAADRLTLRERRALGFTRLNVIRATAKLARAGELPTTKGLTGEDLEAARAEIREAVAAEIMSENVAAWQASVTADRDWSAFFESLIAFLEKMMPLILQLIEIFGAV